MVIGLALSSLSDPENVLVEGYTLVRPAKWLWEPAGEKSMSLCRFTIPGKSEKPLTDVSFFYVNGVQSEIQERVMKNFAKDAKFSESSVAIAKTNLTYVRVRGTTTARKPALLPDYELVGVMLLSKARNQWFFARIFGPHAEVQLAEVDFKKMIEHSLEEAAD
ncbi:MAG: hypothetical protein JWM68_527 [Verrucomicrobiales bacterium]|nr:hypothetical protein [Verrucomicrobiales bacterium]